MDFRTSGNGKVSAPPPAVASPAVPPAAKACVRCHKSKPSAAFYISRSSKDGLQSWCIECTKAYERRRRHTPQTIALLHPETPAPAVPPAAPEEETLKTCPRCMRLLPLGEFYNDRTTPTGRSSYCRDCAREAKAERKAAAEAAEVAAQRTEVAAVFSEARTESGDVFADLYAAISLLAELPKDVRSQALAFVDFVLGMPEATRAKFERIASVLDS